MGPIKEHARILVGVYRSCIEDMLGIYGDNGKENGSHFVWLVGFSN